MCSPSLLCFCSALFPFSLSAAVQLNFDIEILRPGCGGVPTFTFIDKFKVSGAMFLLAGVLFFLACLIRLGIKSCRCCRGASSNQVTALPPTAQRARRLSQQFMQNADGSFAIKKTLPSGGSAADAAELARQRVASVPLSAADKRGSLIDLLLASRGGAESAAWLDFTEHLQHAVFILLVLFYLRVAMLCFKALQCELQPDPAAPTDSQAEQTMSLYLMEDGQTRCYEGAHFILLICVAALGLLYMLGFPCFIFVLLTRAFAGERSGGIIGCCVRSFSCMRGKGTLLQQHLATAIAKADEKRRSMIGDGDDADADADEAAAAGVGGGARGSVVVRQKTGLLARQKTGLVLSDELPEELLDDSEPMTVNMLSNADKAIAEEVQRHREASQYHSGCSSRACVSESRSRSLTSISLACIFFLTCSVRCVIFGFQESLLLHLSARVLGTMLLCGCHKLDQRR